MGSTSMTEDYVKVIYSATEFGGDPLSISAIAARMGVVVSTASENVKRLADEGLLYHQPYCGVELTDAGRALAVRMLRRHRILETYLHNCLGYSWDEVHEDADILEHAASDRLIAAMAEALGNPTHDPHGDPIPSVDGDTHDCDLICASSLQSGDSATVHRVSDSESEVLRYVSSIGIGVGCEIVLETASTAAGIASLLVDGRKVTIGTPALASLWVQKH